MEKNQPEGTIQADASTLDRLGEVLRGYPKTAVKVINRGLRRTEGTARKEISRRLPQVFAISQKEVRESLKKAANQIQPIVGEAGEGSLSIAVFGRRLTATRFQHTPKTPPSRKGKRVNYDAAVTIYRARGMKVLSPRLGKDGRAKTVFIAPNGSGKYLFFRRTGERGEKGREKLEAVWSVAVPQMIEAPGVGEAIAQSLCETMEKRLIHELDYEFGGLGSYLGGK